MKKVKMSGTDLELSTICYGTGNFGEKLDREAAFAVLDRFLDGGGNFIDTANVYCRWIGGMGNSSERYIGQWLKSRKAGNKVVIATKGGHYDFEKPQKCRVTPEEIQKDLEESLRTLGLEQIPLYWLHRDNPAVPIEELVDFMEELAAGGKIKYYGASNFTKERMEQAQIYAAKKGIRGFCAVSNQWSLAKVNPGKNLNQDPSLVMMDKHYYFWHTKKHMPIVPFSSSAQGFFQKLYQAGVVAENGEIRESGNLHKLDRRLMDAYLNPGNLRIYEILCQASKETGLSVLCLALLGLMGNEFQVFPVVSASKEKHMQEIIEAGEQEIDKKLMKDIRACMFL